jgi:hypothetical protein
MKMQRKYVRRRRTAAFIFIGIPALVAAYYVVNHLWWVGNGYCWGTMEKCVGL